MACYYLVISSTHLSNGHFRSIKGVFRGPLRKTGTTLPGYAEKGKSIATALEDLKANFYCELCDKQYHKHQEFDNHINSYDHAHKQRLKELKQREFARNVASKSWKDEKKQEKALKRLHRLAELRKQPDGVADEGPLFKSPRLKGLDDDILTSKDDRIASSTCTVVCKGDPITKERSPDDNKQDFVSDREALNSNCCFSGNQAQLPFSNSSGVNHRAGVSFCFSKKALQKLDSSASVFSESTEDVNECSRFLHHKAKQMPISFRHHAHINENAAENSVSPEKDERDTSPPDDTPASAEKFKDDKSSQENTKEPSEIAQSNITVETPSPDATCVDQSSQKEANVSSETEVTSETLEVRCQAESGIHETHSNKHTVADAILIEHLSNLLSQKHGVAELSCDSNEGTLLASNDPVPNSSECPEHSLGASLNTNSEAKALSFLSVLSKDGNTKLQWPTELLLFTKTQPSISYACNPLYFDFKCSKRNKNRDSNEKVPKSYEHNEPYKNSYEDKASGLNAEGEMEIETDSQSSETKGERCNIVEMTEKRTESYNNYLVRPEFAYKSKFSHLHDNIPKVSTHLSHSRQGFVKENHRSRKRRRSSHDQSENSKKSDHSKIKENSRSNDELKRKRFLHENQLFCNGRCYSSSRFKESKNRGCSSREDSDSSKDSESDTYSEISQKSSFSHVSSSSSSMSSGSSCHHEDLLYRTSTHQTSSSSEACLEGKHNSEPASENTSVSGEDTNLKCKCKNQKHNKFNELSQHECSENCPCSKHARNKHRCRRKHEGLGTNSIIEGSKFKQLNNCESSETVDTKLDNSSASPKDLRHLSNSPNITHHTENVNINTNEISCITHSSNMMPFSVTCGNISENTILNNKESEENTMIVELSLEGEDSATEITEDISANTKSSIAIQCPPENHEIQVLPLIDNLETNNNKEDTYGIDGTLQNVIAIGESKRSEVPVVTANANKCFINDIINISTERRTEVPVEELPGQLMSDLRPFMQSQLPVHLNFSCELPSLRHPGGTNSPDTKEAEARLGRPDVNMKLGYVEGNIKCCYDSSMQDFRKPDVNRRFHHKSASAPLAQQPLTFSPDEVDKYKLLQIQAQQHMQKQRLTKHFKALPTPGPAVFSNAQTVQPVSVQHHPITTIHHTLMQRYAVTASMHSHINHFPLPHLSQFPQSQFSPITLSSLTPALFPTPAPLMAGHPIAHPLHLVSTTAIHPGHLTIQAIPHATLIPTLIAPHPNAPLHNTLQLHPFIHPLFHGQDFHHHSGPSHLH